MSQINLDNFLKQSVLSLDSYSFFQLLQQSEQDIKDKEKQYEQGKHWFFSLRFTSIFFSLPGMFLVLNNHSFGMIFTIIGFINAFSVLCFSRQQWIKACKLFPGYKKLIQKKEQYRQQLLSLLSQEQFQFELIHMFQEFMHNLNEQTIHVANDYALDSIKHNIKMKIEQLSDSFSARDYEDALQDILSLHHEIETLEKSLKKQTYMNQYYQRLNHFLDKKKQSHANEVEFEL
jgi:hypothetical protein